MQTIYGFGQNIPGDPEQGGGTPGVIYNDTYSFFEYAIPRIWTLGTNITF